MPSCCSAFDLRSVEGWPPCRICSDGEGYEACWVMMPLIRLLSLQTQSLLAVQPSDHWLDPLIAVPSIDPGEAQLLAASAESGLLVLTGDKRGLCGVKDIPGYAEALDGQVVVLEAIVAELCVKLGVDGVRSRIRPLMEVDAAVRVCFSVPGYSPLEGLRSYYEDLALSLDPLNLWKPFSLGWA